MRASASSARRHFGCRALVGFLALRIQLFMRCAQLFGCGQEFAARRVSEAQLLVVPPQLQSQNLAVSPVLTVRLANYFYRLVHAVDQNIAGKRRIVILSARRVESPVLAHSVGSVALALHGVVSSARAARRYLKNEVRRLAHLAYHITVASNYPLGIAYSVRENAVGNEIAGIRRRKSAHRGDARNAV